LYEVRPSLRLRVLSVEFWGFQCTNGPKYLAHCECHFHIRFTVTIHATEFSATLEYN
jgi:hypothetical protein